MIIFGQSEIEASVIFLVGLSASTAVIPTLTVVVIDYLLVLLMSSLSRASITQIYKYLNETGWGTARLLSYMTNNGRSVFRELIER